MKTHTINGKTITLPSTPDELELYADVPGADEAAEVLCGALAGIVDEIAPHVADGYLPSIDKLTTFMQTRIAPVLDKYADQGGADSEPHNQCLDAIERAVATLIGRKVRS